MKCDLKVNVRFKKLNCHCKKIYTIDATNAKHLQIKKMN